MNLKRQVWIKYLSFIYLNWSTIISTILSAAYPSPYGFVAFAIFLYSDSSFKRRFISLNIPSSSRPISLAVPASTPSGLSVSLLTTKTGFPRVGASSCTPPESVIIRYDFFL